MEGVGYGQTFQNGESLSPFLLISWDSIRFVPTQPPPRDGLFILWDFCCWDSCHFQNGEFLPIPLQFVGPHEMRGCSHGGGDTATISANK